MDSRKTAISAAAPNRPGAPVMSDADISTAQQQQPRDDGTRTPGGHAFGLPSSDGHIRLGADIEIFPNKPRPDLASFGCKAFEAMDKRNGMPLIVQLAPPHLVPRITNVGSYKNIKSPSVVRIHEAGIVYWTPEDRQYFALAMDTPPQKKLMDSFDAKPVVLNEDQIVSSLIKPMMVALGEFLTLDMVHGGIVPENIFFTGSDNNLSAVLGEGLTSAPFFRHHVLYETIERGQAQPSGRGTGTVQNDYYSLGVCVAFAIRGENLMAGKSNEEILRQKLLHGSYITIVGRERVPSNLGEFLRGVLNDDPKQRWGYEEIMDWMEGRHATTKQSPITMKAARPYIFREEKIWDLRTLAMLFSLHVGDAAQAIEKDNFNLWIKRNFEDKVLQDRLALALDQQEIVSKDRQVSAVISAIDPVGPVRYKGLSLFPAGFGTALADAMARGEDIQPYGELIGLQIMSSWINHRFEEILDATSLLTTFEKCRNYLTQRMPGYGIERVVYTLNKEVACLSPLFGKLFVMGPGQLLLALELVSKQKNRPENMFDRHIVAFLAVREQKMIDPYLGHIVSREKSNQILGVLQALAAIQKRFMTGPVPSIGGWLLSMVPPVLERYRDRDLREEISKRLNKLSEPGDLNVILDLVDTLSVQQDDYQRYMMARQEYALLVGENAVIEDRLKKRHVFGIDTGRQTAMLLSVFFSTLCILAFAGFYFLSK